MKQLKEILFVVLLLCTAIEVAYGQDLKAKPTADKGYAPRWRLGLTLGPDFYYGDLNASKFLPERSISFAAGLYTEYQVTNVFGFRIHLLGSWLNGSKPVVVDGTSVDEAFTGILAEGSLNAQINFSNLFTPYKSTRRFFVYGTLGVGYAGWYTKLINKVYDAETIDSDNPVNNFNSAPVVPVGLGFNYALGNKVNLGLEWTFRTVLSDMVDQTAGGFKFDIYNYLAFGVSINLGKSPSKKIQPNNYAYPVVTPPPSNPLPQPAEPERITMPVQPEPYTYVVQIFAFDKHRYSPEWIRKRYKVPQPVRMEKEGAMERFLVGTFNSPTPAFELREEMIRLGIKDAFVVAYKNGIRSHVVRSPD